MKVSTVLLVSRKHENVTSDIEPKKVVESGKVETMNHEIITTISLSPTANAG